MIDIILNPKYAQNMGREGKRNLIVQVIKNQSG